MATPTYVVRETMVVDRPRDEMDWDTIASFDTAEEAKEFADKRRQGYIDRGYRKPVEIRVECW